MTKPLRRTTAALATSLLLAAGALSACGGSDTGTGTDQTAGEAAADPGVTLGEAADQTVCAADATAIAAPYGDGFPTTWTFPTGTVVYNYEEREGTGAIVTGVTTTPFDDVLTYLNTDEVANGFKVANGETEEDDAEANWTSEDFTGRWTIKKSSSCDGETIIQVLATQAG